jgi:hypothetical protein
MAPLIASARAPKRKSAEKTDNLTITLANVNVNTPCVVVMKKKMAQ